MIFQAAAAEGIEVLAATPRVRDDYPTTPAHPERNATVQDKPRRVEEIVEAGTLVQLTAGSLNGRGGPGSAKRAVENVG